MSRYIGSESAQRILDAAQKWRSEALIGDGSVLGEDSLWVPRNFEVLDRVFIQNPDDGEGTYLEKLNKQLKSTNAEAKQLAAELNWLMLLCPSNITPESKRNSVETIWSWSYQSIPSSAASLLSDDVLSGVGSAGPGFNNHRWREFAFAIRFALTFKQLEASKRITLLQDGWAFAEWIELVTDARARQLRHMILWLLFPDDFERIFGGNDRRAVALFFSGLSSQAVNAQSPIELDRTLRSVRVQLESKYSTNELDYYVAPLKGLWKSGFQPAKDITIEHVYEALSQIDKNGIPERAESTGYDLVHEGKRYPPKVVLSLAAKAANGTEFDRSLFSGGENSSAFRLLRKLGFNIERKTILEDIIRQFVKKTEVTNDFTVREFPSEYRSLKVAVSFGKGTPAHVPWMAFLGPGQQISRGIYPAVFCFREAKWLIVVYGISESERPNTQWPKHVQDLQHVDEFFEKTVGSEPYRYGESIVAEAFNLNENLDLGKVAQAVEKTIDQFFSLVGNSAVETVVPEELTPERPYTLEDAIEGLFVDAESFAQIVNRLRTKRNVILQGPPGVGKSYFARRLAYALMSREAKERVGMVQFHATYAYEDFIQGYRPGKNGGFSLKNGTFFEFCTTAAQDLNHDYVFIIDEINRGNLSKIFGELMLLIESDKREEQWAIPLTYAENSETKFFVTPNVHMIGLMNTADRSIAMVDYALRRRFSFIDLSPAFASPHFSDYLRSAGAEETLVKRLISDMTELNADISSDKNNLGPGFCIGHSYFCSTGSVLSANDTWYREIIRCDIIPLLKEYWFDDVERAQRWEQRLLG